MVLGKREVERGQGRGPGGTAPSPSLNPLPTFQKWFNFAYSLKKFPTPAGVMGEGLCNLCWNPAAFPACPPLSQFRSPGPPPPCPLMNFFPSANG